MYSAVATSTSKSSIASSSTTTTRMNMILLRSPSSQRLFLILLHLVGVSHHLPKQFHGIVGVHPCSMVLERLELEKYADGLDGWLRAMYQQQQQQQQQAVQQQQSEQQRRQQQQVLQQQAEQQQPIATTSPTAMARPVQRRVRHQHRNQQRNAEQPQHQQQDFLADPFWLQDTWDGKCLGPLGFSDCGDATLWRIRQRRPLPDELKRQRRWMGVFEEVLHYDDVVDLDKNDHHRHHYSNQQQQQQQQHRVIRGFALQLVDPADLLNMATTTPINTTVTTTANNRRNKRQERSNNSNQNHHHNGIEQRECLLYNPRTKTLEMGSCTPPTGSRRRNKLRAWSWKFNSKGVLFLESRQQNVNQQRLKRQHHGINDADDPLACLWRINQTQPHLSYCNSNPSQESMLLLSSSSSSSLWHTRSQQQQQHSHMLNNNNNNNDQQHRVHFALIRYQVNHGGLQQQQQQQHDTVTNRNSDTTVATKSAKIQGRYGQRSPRPQHHHHHHPQESRRQGLPHTMDIAHEHAKTSSYHHTTPPQVKKTGISSSRTVTESLTATTSSMKHNYPKLQQSLHFAVFRDSNPILFIGGDMASSRMYDDEDEEDDQQAMLTNADDTAILHPPQVTTTTTSLHIPRISMNPYISASSNEKWVDPKTGLEYLTDLCSYLGHDRKESGRHTLVGVGQYVKARFIKIYGVAMYISKRDVLADPASAQYAGLSSEELRSKPDFYMYLRSMPSRTDTNSGLFDRTLFLKTNMQLSTDTMRSSLQADWKMLTDEAKEILISTSLKPRPMTDALLQRVLNPATNPGRCSCSQEAPPEYDVDPTCCARGTELVFTWRKNGNVEIRLNGELMEIFPRPDIARGIFYEYLRYDDPISPDFRDHVVDGFPFLLAPLAQIKGIGLPPLAFHRQASFDATRTSPGTSLSRAIDGFCDAISSQASEWMDALQQSVDEMSGHATKAIESAKETAQNLATEMDRRRHLAWTHVMSASEHGMNVLSGKVRHPITWVSNFIGSSSSRIKQHHQVANTIYQVPIILPFMAETTTRPLMPLQAPKGRGTLLRHSLVSWFVGELPYIQAPDEIEPMVVHPTSNLSHKLFWGLVHLYLLVLLIVSLPGYNTRTKFVLRRNSKHTATATTASRSNSSVLDESVMSSENSQSDCERGEEEEEDSEDDLASFTPEKPAAMYEIVVIGDCWSKNTTACARQDDDDMETCPSPRRKHDIRNAKFASSAQRLLSRGRDAVMRKVSATSRGRIVSSDDEATNQQRSAAAAQPIVKGRMTKSLSYAL